MAEIGVPELLIILAIVLVILGPGRLAGVGGALGQSIRNFREAMDNPVPGEVAEEQHEERRHV